MYPSAAIPALLTTKAFQNRCRASDVGTATPSQRQAASAQPFPLRALSAERTIRTMRFVIAVFFAAPILAACGGDSEDLRALREEVAALRTQVSAASAASPRPGTPLASTPTPTATFTPTATATPEPPTATPTPPPPPPPPPPPAPTPTPAPTVGPRRTSGEVSSMAYSRYCGCFRALCSGPYGFYEFRSHYEDGGIWRIIGPFFNRGGLIISFTAEYNENTESWTVVHGPPGCY